MAQDLIRRVLMKIDKNYLPYEYFDALPNFTPTEVMQGVVVNKLPTDKGIYFHANFRKGTKIIEHYHNSKEFFHITKGKIILNGDTELGEGDEFIFNPFELHNIKVLEECEMYVQFTKDESFKKFR